VAAMPILRLLQDGVYGPSEIEIMKSAYEQALKISDLLDHTSAAAELLAFRVVALFKSGETDPHLIARRAAETGGMA
jgi:hypothetical protein